MTPRPASRTAVLVCQGRAVADGRLAVGRFDDPTAAQMLSAAEREPVDLARSDEPPRSARARVDYETMRAHGEVMAPRTIAIDEGLRGRPNPQLVVLGAGLDGRAWRMAELAAVDVFEVDEPASQADKRARVSTMQPVAGALNFVPVDFRTDDLDAALVAAGHRQAEPTTWIWEGVVPYLTPADVEATVRAVRRRSAPGSRLIVNYQSPSIAAAVGRLVARALAILSRRGDPLANEPRRSAWTAAAMRNLLESAGFVVVSDQDLLAIAASEGVPIRHPKSLRLGRVAIADVALS